MILALTNQFNRFKDLFSFKTAKSSHGGFGTFYGVYVPSILMMFGVIIFLRLGWILGVVGLYPTLLIVTFATIITLITTLSMSAAATNIKVGKGGAYYIISRSLGIEAGSAIGIPLVLKQSISIAFCVVGFAESFHDLLPQFSIPIIGIVTLALLTALAYISTNFALKIQMVIFFIIIASIYSLFSGSHHGFEEYSTTHHDPSTISLWAVFAIFFPALTGIESSVSLSGDLKNPSRSLPLGTIAAVITAYVVYMAIPVFLWNNVSPEQLVNDPMVMGHVAKYESLIILGIWGATLSSAIGGILGAPRTMQALAEDGILPRVLGREYGPAKEPRIATAVTVMIALIAVCFGSINMIAPLLTMICLISYATLNLATGLEALMSNPSWRPTFHLPWIVSFTGAILCLLAMLMINTGAAILSIFFVAILFVVLKKKGISAAWDDIRYGILMYYSRSSIYKLASNEPSSRSWRPNCIVFTSNPLDMTNQLMSFASSITHTQGFLTLASFTTDTQSTTGNLAVLNERIKDALKQHRIDALVALNQTDCILSGMKQMILHYGMGPLTPNTIVCGSPSKEGHLTPYLEMIKLAHEQGRNTVIFNNDPQSNYQDGALFRIRGERVIHVWWDDQSPNNAKLMLVLAHMLQKSPFSNGTRVRLIGVVEHENLRLEKLAVFNRLIKRNRLKIETSVLVSGDTSNNHLELIKHFSADAAMIFIGMRAPGQDETVEDYAHYFRSLPYQSEVIPPVALVSCAKQTNLKDVVYLKAAKR